MQNNENKFSREFFEKYMLCPVITNPEDFYTLSNPMIPPYRKVDVNIYPCTLSDTSQCMAQSEISKMSWRIAFVRTSFNPSKKTDPITKQLHFEDIAVNIYKEVQ